MLKLASSIGFALALAELKQRIRRLVTQGILGAIGGVILLIGLCFLLVAAHLYLSILLNPIASAAIIGGVLVVIALILFAVARAKGGGGSRQASPPPRAEAAQENIGRLGETLGGSPLANSAFLVAGLALVLGFMFGRRSKGDD